MRLSDTINKRKESGPAVGTSLWLVKRRQSIVYLYNIYMKRKLVEERGPTTMACQEEEEHSLFN